MQFVHVGLVGLFNHGGIIPTFYGTSMMSVTGDSIGTFPGAICLKLNTAIQIMEASAQPPSYFKLLIWMQ